MVSNYMLPGALAEFLIKRFEGVPVRGNVLKYLHLAEKYGQTRIFSLGQRHIILSPIDAHYKWPQNKIY